MGELHTDDNYAKTLALSLNDYRKGKIMCDVVIFLSPNEYLAHRNVLCASSPYFLECLGSDTAHTTLGSRIELNTINSDIMEDVLNFMYIGEICVGEENVRKLIAASDVLQMKNLKELSCRFYEKRLCPSNCLSIAALADEFNCDTLREAADKFILQHFLDVCNYNEFKALSCSHIEKLLSSNDINVQREEQIYEAAMKWIHFDLNTRKTYLSKVLACVRISRTSKYFIRDVLEQDGTLMSDPFCVTIINEAKFILDYPDRRHLIKPKAIHKPRNFSDVSEILVICGGSQERMSSSEVLCYIPEQDFWYPLAPLIHTRYNSSSIVKGNEIYCIGGKTEGKPSNKIEKYSPSMDKWQENISLPSLFSGHVACIFNDEIFVIGGEENESSSSKVTKFSIHSGKWITVQNMKIPRKFSAVAVHESLYVIGGYDSHGLPLASVERYNPYSNEWSKIFPMNSARACASAKCVGDNIYVFGGEYAMWSYYRSAEIFSIKTDEWTSLSDMSVPRSYMGIALLDNFIYLVGGMVSSEGSDQYGVSDDEDFVDVNETNLVECYCIETNLWRKLSSLPVKTADPNCVVLSASKSYLESRFGF